MTVEGDEKDNDMRRRRRRVGKRLVEVEWR